MTTREKNLLAVLGIAFFLILNFVAYLKFYEPEVLKANRAKLDAEILAADVQARRARNALWPELSVSAGTWRPVSGSFRRRA